MNNLSCEVISHAKGRDGVIENADCKALEFDRHFRKTYPSERVDYIDIIENGLILIELKDISSRVRHLSKKDKNVDNIKLSIANNLTEKHDQSVLISRDKIQKNLISVIFYIVVKNNTDVVFINNFLEIEQRNANFHICRTNEICNKLSAFNTRKCQE